MKEVEVKARLHNKELVMQNLRDKGCVFEEPITQNDIVFVEKIVNAETYASNDVFLRIRLKNKSKTIFTLKKPLTDGLDCMEYETEIDSGEQMEKAILSMGYKEALRINKVRVITHFNGCEICIDEVEELGSFIEMEKLTTEDDGSEKIKEELFDFLQSVGVKKEDRVFDGYDDLTILKREQK